jgi:hypothetical protein
VESVFDNKVLAQRMALLGEPVRAGDPVVVPSSPVVYLYTNLEDKDAFPPYQQLLQTLIDENYEVVEVFEPPIRARTDRYGVLLRLEASGKVMVLKLQSLYSGDTFFSRAWKPSARPQAKAPAGRPVRLARMTPAPEEGRAAPEAPTGREAAPPPEAPREAPGFEKARPVSEKERFRLDEPFHRLAICNLDGFGRPEAVLLNNEGIEAFRMDSATLEPVGGFSFDEAELVALHLHAMDVNGDGCDELMVTLGHEADAGGRTTTRLRSMVLAFDGDGFDVLADHLPYYLRVIQDRGGRQVLLGQKIGQYDPFEGDIVKLEWDTREGAFNRPREYDPAHNIYSIYQFSLIPGDPERVMILEPSSFIHVYLTATETVEAVSDDTYGDYREIPYKIQLSQDKYLGGFDKETHRNVFAPRRFVLKTGYDDQVFLIKKERAGVSVSTSFGTLMDFKQGKDSIAAVKWTGKNIHETWQSDEMSKDIVDFAFDSRDGSNSIIGLVRDSQGYTLEAIR